jgi:hypothetical protein
MSLMNDVADDVVTLLNQHVFSQVFAAVRSKRPSYELEELDALAVVVTGRGVDLESGNRSKDLHGVLIEIAVINKLAGNENTDTDPLDDLVQEIVDYLRRHALPTAEAQYQTASYETITDEELLERQQCFFGLISITYQGLR